MLAVDRRQLSVVLLEVPADEEELEGVDGAASREGVHIHRTEFGAEFHPVFGVGLTRTFARPHR